MAVGLGALQEGRWQELGKFVCASRWFKRYNRKPENVFELFQLIELMECFTYY